MHEALPAVGKAAGPGRIRRRPAADESHLPGQYEHARGLHTCHLLDPAGQQVRDRRGRCIARTGLPEMQDSHGRRLRARKRSGMLRILSGGSAPARGHVDGAEIYDIAPTILAAFDIPLVMDGIVGDSSDDSLQEELERK